MTRWRVWSRCPVRDEDWRLVGSYSSAAAAEAVAGNIRAQCLLAKVTEG